MNLTLNQIVEIAGETLRGNAPTLNMAADSAQGFGPIILPATNVAAGTFQDNADVVKIAVPADNRPRYYVLAYMQRVE